jgi:hypothetical protein
MARLVLAILANAGHRSDRGNRQKCEPGDLEPELVQHLPKGKGSRADGGQHGLSRPASLQNGSGGAVKELDFFHHLTVDHESVTRSVASVDFSSGGGYNDGGQHLKVVGMPPLSGVRFEGDSWISN